MKIEWPTRGERESFEINGFIAAYTQLHPELSLVIEQKGERPDFVIKDVLTNRRFGIELTSVYLDDRSVPDVHKKPIDGPTDIEYDPSKIEQYLGRTLNAIQKKIILARTGYDASLPLILSVYANEYICIHTDIKTWEKFVKTHEGAFDAMHPFSEVVIWNLPDDGVFSVRP